MSPEVIPRAVLKCVRFPLSLPNAEDLLFERGIDLCHDTEWFWWGSFGLTFSPDCYQSEAESCG